MHGTESLVDVVLGEMARHDGPVGARMLWKEVQNGGHAVSESTISRILTELDGQDLTRVVGKKGRELTPDGRRVVETLRAEAQRDAQLDEALHIRGPEELLDLLAARRGLERETVRAAAERADPHELERLHELTSVDFDAASTDHWHERIDFHAYIGSISHNKQLVALTEVAFDPRRDGLEKLIFLVGMRAGDPGLGHAEHRAIAAAIRARDADTAESLMVRHLDGLMAKIADFTASASPEVIEGLFPGRPVVPTTRRMFITINSSQASPRQNGTT